MATGFTIGPDCLMIDCDPFCRPLYLPARSVPFLWFLLVSAGRVRVVSAGFCWSCSCVVARHSIGVP
jgi:hypothetical protein